MSFDTVTRGAPTASQMTGPQGLILDATNNVVYSYSNSSTDNPGAVPLLGAAGTATTATAGTASALPTDPAGYLEVPHNGGIVKIPYYNV